MKTQYKSRVAGPFFARRLVSIRVYKCLRSLINKRLAKKGLATRDLYCIFAALRVSDYVIVFYLRISTVKCSIQLTAKINNMLYSLGIASPHDPSIIDPQSAKYIYTRIFIDSVWAIYVASEENKHNEVVPE